MEEKGFIKLSRKFFSTSMWNQARTFSECEAWLDLIQSARFDATPFSRSIVGREITYSRGQYPASVRFLSKKWKWTEWKVREFLNSLKKDGMITTEMINGQTIITLCNYDKYNYAENTAHTENHTENHTLNLLIESKINEILTQQVTQQVTHCSHTAHTNIKKDKKEKNINTCSNSDELLCETSQSHAEKIDYDSLISFFNTETKGVFGSIRPPLSDKRKKMISARIKEYGKKTFVETITKAYASSFLKGQNKSGWTADFDWIIKPTNFEKILSGNYDDNKQKQRDQTVSSRPTQDELNAAVAIGIGIAAAKKNR